jgi:hypothetical protein
MSYPNYNNTMIGDSFSTVGTVTTGTVTVPNNTSNGLYWGLNGTSNTIIADPNIKGATLKVNGDADFEGEVTIKGKSLYEMLDKIEERLAILHPNPELEDRWDELKELGKRYKELEQELLEKEKVWNILKK